MLFSSIFNGCDGRLRRELLFDQAPANSPNPFIGCSEKADAPAEFSALKEALQQLAVTEQEQLAIWKIAAAVCHLGWAGAVKGTYFLPYVATLIALSCLFFV